MEGERRPAAVGCTAGAICCGAGHEPGPASGGAVEYRACGTPLCPDCEGTGLELPVRRRFGTAGVCGRCGRTGEAGPDTNDERRAE